MLVMPLEYKDKIYVVEVGLRDKESLNESAFFENFSESDLIIGNRKFSESSYSSEKNDLYKAVTRFIRYRFMYTNKDKYVVTTRSEKDSLVFDTFAVKAPSKYVNDGLESLYGACVIDIMRSIPHSLKKRDISLKTFGILDSLDKEKLNEFMRLSSNDGFKDYSEFRDVITNVIDIFDFLDNFEFRLRRIVKSKEEIDRDIEFFDECSSDTSNRMSKFSKRASDNGKIYKQLVAIYGQVFNEPLRLFDNSQVKEKKKVKVGDSLHDKEK